MGLFYLIVWGIGVVLCMFVGSLLACAHSWLQHVQYGEGTREVSGALHRYRPITHRCRCTRLAKHKYFMEPNALNY